MSAKQKDCRIINGSAFSNIFFIIVVIIRKQIWNSSRLLFNWIENKRTTIKARPKHLSIATTARVIWLCACVRYWPDRGLVFECVTCFCCCLKKRTTFVFNYDGKPTIIVFRVNILGCPKTARAAGSCPRYICLACTFKNTLFVESSAFGKQRCLRLLLTFLAE